MKLNEVDKIIKYREEGLRSIKISWKMTEWCNYQCAYCYMADKITTELSPSQEEIESVACGINGLINKIERPAHLQLIGGEPSLYNIVKALENIDSEFLKSMIMVTNFSKPYEYYKEIVDYCNSRKIALKFNASFHIEELDKRKGVRPFIEKAIALKKYLSVKVMINEDNKEWYRPYLDKLLFASVPLCCGTVRDSDNKCIESSDILEFVQKYNDGSLKRNKETPYVQCIDVYGNVHDYYSSTQIMEDIEGGFKPTGFRCTVGVDCLRILPNGDLRRGGCKQGFKPRLGNVLGEYTIPTEPIICQSERNCSLCYFTDIERVKND